jgi:hypothetical protein
MGTLEVFFWKVLNKFFPPNPENCDCGLRNSCCDCHPKRYIK